MTPLIKKEIRLLLPAWIAAMLLAIFPPFLVWAACQMNIMAMDWSLEPCRVLASDVPIVFALGLLILGISSFGQELSSNSFGMLLSQPVDRRHVWLVKIILLGIGFVSIWLAATFLVSWQFDVWKSTLSAERLSALDKSWLPTLADLESFRSNALEFLTLSALVAFGGGLWATLLLRQTASAFWVALLTPLAIFGGLGAALGFFPISDQAINAVTTIALVCYSIAGFVWARRMFLRAQDVQWTGVEQTGSFIRLPRNRFLALTWKEIRLHEVSLFIAAVLLAVHVAALVLHPLVSNRNTKMMLELVWSLWLLMPLLVGSAAVAEERKLGVLDTQLCLPAFRRSQFWIKFFVAFILSVTLGALMPTVIERSHDFGTHWYPYWIFAAAAAIFFVSFYASTLTRSTLHAIGVTIVIPIIVWFGLVVFCILAFHVLVRSPGNFNYRDYEDICRAQLMLILCLFVFPVIFAALMFWNFKWLHQGWKVIQFNVTTVLITLALLFALSNAIYYRPWELPAPIESPHGPARLSAETPVKLSFEDDRNKMICLLPGGRLWEQQIKIYWVGRYDLQRWSPLLHTENFIGGTNWVQVADDGFYILGLRQNGSLWAMPQAGGRVRMAQIGSDTDWLKVAASGSRFLLLKKNGTLWLWGTNELTYDHPGRAKNLAKIKLDLAMPPVRIDPETSWTDMVPLDPYRALAQKSNGGFWTWQEKEMGTNQVWGLVDETNLDHQWSSYTFDNYFSAEIKTNGELWLLEEPAANWQHGDWRDRPNVPPYTKKIKLDSDPVWKTVSFSGYDSLILLRQDGTLWTWKYSDHKPFRPVQLGRQSDWVALSTDERMGIALAADGSLWSWSDASDHFWLAPSRKPVYMGNILQGMGGNL